MSVTPERPPGVGPPDGHDTPMWPSGRPLWQQFLIGAVGVLVVVGIILAVVRVWAIPALQSRGADAGIAGEATLAALQTQQALTPRPTPTVAPAVQPTTAPTVAPTRAPTSAPAVAPTAASTTEPTSQPTPQIETAPGVARTVGGAPQSTKETTATVTEPNGLSSGPLPVESLGTLQPLINGTPYPIPTSSPEDVSAVSDAYLGFWSAYSDAFARLDPAPLDGVAAGDYLTSLQNDIEQERSLGRAQKVDIQHQFRVLIVTNGNAAVLDDMRDSSTYVDAATHEPLPGQVIPASPDLAPELKAIYKLVLIDDVWKVVQAIPQP